jgi:integrase
MSSISYDRFISEILDLYRPPQRRKATHDKMRKVLREFGALGGVTRTSHITPGSIVRWISSHQDRRATTNRSYLSSFRAAVRIAAKMGWVKVSPWEIRTDWIPAEDLDDDHVPPPRHLSLAEVGRLLEQADAEANDGGWKARRLQCLVYCYLYTGIRKNEALGMLAKDVDLAGRFVRIQPNRKRRLKSRASRRKLALHPELAEVLGHWMPVCGSEYLFPGVQRKGPWLSGLSGYRPLDAVKGLAARAQIPHCTIQALRRTVATHGRRWGWGQLELRELLGHAADETSYFYLEDDLAGQRETIGRIAYRRTG